MRFRKPIFRTAVLAAVATTTLLLSGCAIVPAPMHRHHGPVVVQPAPPVVVQPGYGYGRGYGHSRGSHHGGHRGHGYY